MLSCRGRCGSGADDQASGDGPPKKFRCPLERLEGAQRLLVGERIPPKPVHFLYHCPDELLAEEIEWLEGRPIVERLGGAAEQARQRYQKLGKYPPK